MSEHEIDEPWSPVDGNGNQLHEIQQHPAVERLLPEEHEIVGVDHRGLACFADGEIAYYVRLTPDQRLDFFDRQELFGGDVDTHIQVVSERFGLWKWLTSR